MAAAAGAGRAAGPAVDAVATFDDDQSFALEVLCGALKFADVELPDATAAALMARAVAVEREVVRLTAAAAAAAAAKDCDAEAAAEAELKSLMASPQRWVTVAAPVSADPTPLPASLFASLMAHISADPKPVAFASARRRSTPVCAWYLRALLALRVSAPTTACAATWASASASASSSAPPAAAASGPTDPPDRPGRTTTPVSFNTPYHEWGGATALVWAVSNECVVVADALLDLPHAYGLDVSAIDAHGRSAAWAACACAVLHPALIARVLPRSSAVALNTAGLAYASASASRYAVVLRQGQPVRTPPLLALWSTRRRDAPSASSSWRALVAVLAVCCSDERVCPSDGTGLDPLTPAWSSAQHQGRATTAAATSESASESSSGTILTPAAVLDDVERWAVARERDGTNDVERAVARRRAVDVRAGCALVRGAMARLAAYADGFAAALSGALCDCGVTQMPVPVQAIVAGYAFKPSLHPAPQWGRRS